MSAGSEDLSQSLEARVQEFTLSNGLHFIVLERHIAPIVSCHTYADVGAFDEVDGQTGAHSFLLCASSHQQQLLSTLVTPHPSTFLQGLHTCWSTWLSKVSIGAVSKCGKVIALTHTVACFTLYQLCMLLWIASHCHFSVIPHADRSFPASLLGLCSVFAYINCLLHAGSPRIGTKDYGKEAPILEALDEGNCLILIVQCKILCEACWHICCTQPSCFHCLCMTAVDSGRQRQTALLPLELSSAGFQYTDASNNAAIAELFLNQMANH